MISRRDFLKGVGVAAAAGAALPALPGLAEEDGTKAPAGIVLGPGPVMIALTVNGETRRLQLEPRTTLLSALRDHLGITGPKSACDRASCGACTVLRDGEPICACMTLAIENQGRAITTIEGLGTPERPSALQQAFVAHDALQCGFCTPGMVTSLEALLRRQPEPTLEQVQAAVSGNLCRCGAYPHVFQAALAAARKER
jgi:xanthine dehydrogenase YagT iron-sulfur-binding subunit